MPRVLIGGTFDPLHAGHVHYIRAAQSIGTVTCAVSDNPWKHPPLVPIADRVVMLQALGCDARIAGPGLADFLGEVRPDVYLTGLDWEHRLPPPELRMCLDLGIEIRHCDTRVNSSSDLLASYERARNAEKLAALEAFVQQQTPASKPWEPVTDYSRDERRRIEAPQADIIAEVFKDCSTIDIGCGFGYLVEMLRERGMGRAFGVDVPAFDITAEWLDDTQIKSYELAVCREVLEHLTAKQLTWAVRNLAMVSTRFIYVTTRFATGSHLLDVDGADDLDPTHLSMLNQDMLRTLFVLEGCTRRADLETALDHRNLGRVLVYQVPA